MKNKEILVLIVVITMAMLSGNIQAAPTFQVFVPSNVTVVLIIGGGGGGLTDTCTPNGGTCADSCATGSRQLSYSCAETGKVCCSMNLCIIASSFLSQYGTTYTSIDLDNFAAKYPGISKGELKDYIDNYNTRCGAALFSIFDLPYIGKPLESLGKAFSITNPEGALTVLLFVIAVIVVIYLIRKKRR